MVQRFGRVNRRGGDGKRANIDVVCEEPADPKKKDDLFDKARWQTRALLERLPLCGWDALRRDASPSALAILMSGLSEEEREATFTPPPTVFPVTDILFDAWAWRPIEITDYRHEFGSLIDVWDDAEFKAPERTGKS